MQKLHKTNVEQAEQHALRLKAAQDKASQYLHEQRYWEAQRALKQATKIQGEEIKRQRLAAAQTEREKALALTNEGKFAEAGQALQRANELATRPIGDNDRTDGAEQQMAELVKESSMLVKRYAKIAAGLCFIPIPFFDFTALMTVQVLLVRQIAHLFGHTATKEQIRGLIISLVGAIIPTGVGQGVGAALSLSALPALVTGAVVYVVATPLMAYALTRAVGNVFIMHFESGGTLLTFDPKAFTEYFVNEFKKAGGTLRQAEDKAPAAASEVPA